MCIDKLARLGFTEKEALVYLMLLRMGASPVSAVAQRVSLKRVTVYAILDALATRGLVATVDTDQGRRYIPQDPTCLLGFLQEEQKSLLRKVKVAEECVKELESPFLASVTELRRVRFHEGFLSVQKALTDGFMGEAPLNGLISLPRSGEARTLLKNLQSQRQNDAHLTVFQDVEADLFAGGSLLVQDETVGFLAPRASLELMIIRDPFYAQYVKQVLFFPYFSKKSVGATISKCSPVKG